MTETGATFKTERIEHLKLLQATVGRMAEASAAMKRYALLIAAAALALAGSAGLPAVPVFAAVLMAVFWALDARYLQQEHWFRNMYDAAREGRLDLFVLTPDAATRGGVSLGAKLASWSTAGLYLPLTLFLLICTAVLAG
jgi:hypothetical protein